MHVCICLCVCVYVCGDDDERGPVRGAGCSPMLPLRSLPLPSSQELYPLLGLASGGLAGAPGVSAIASRGLGTCTGELLEPGAASISGLLGPKHTHAHRETQVHAHTTHHNVHTD